MNQGKAYRFQGLFQDKHESAGGSLSPTPYISSGQGKESNPNQSENSSNWIIPAYVTLDNLGNIESITTEAIEDINYENVDGYAIPGMQNAHSHAFQYAMVGLTEQHVLGTKDDFWGWRKAMYELALSIDPDQMEAVATLLYKEMLRHGYTEVAEFHYVHHDLDGGPYDNRAELGARLVSAAKTAGIKITLIPIYYKNGDFGKPAVPGQLRFLSQDLEEYQLLLDASYRAVSNYDNASIGYGFHSMRAANTETIKTFTDGLDGTIPFHMHISEQLKEVDASLAYLNQRPIEWLLNNINVGEHFHLVHCTHLTDKETMGLAKSGANAVLCPSTEGNLGDGIFPLKKFQDAGGHWSIGTDSHIGINPFEELRMLDYRQRVTSHIRNTFNDANEGDSGRYAIKQSVSNGRKAMGKIARSSFNVGDAFDALVVDNGIPLIAVCSSKNLLSTIIYGSDASMYLGTMVNGEWIIKGGRHQSDDMIQNNFIKSLKQLNNR